MTNNCDTRQDTKLNISPSFQPNVCSSRSAYILRKGKSPRATNKAKNDTRGCKDNTALVCVQ